jgi:hypothetical protein
MRSIATISHACARPYMYIHTYIEWLGWMLAANLKRLYGASILQSEQQYITNCAWSANHPVLIIV